MHRLASHKAPRLPDVTTENAFQKIFKRNPKILVEQEQSPTRESIARKYSQAIANAHTVLPRLRRQAVL